jgi:hypothetical protein
VTSTPSASGTPTITADPENLYEIPTLQGAGVAAMALLLLGIALAFLARARR